MLCLSTAPRGCGIRVLCVCLITTAATALQSAELSLGAVAETKLVGPHHQHNRKKSHDGSKSDALVPGVDEEPGEEALSKEELERCYQLPVNVMPDKSHMRKGGPLVRLLAPVRRYKFSFVKFVRRLLDERAAPVHEEEKKPSNYGVCWTIAFFATLAILAVITREFCSRMKVELPPPDEDLAVARGLPCWAYVGALFVFHVSTVVFWMTIVSIRMVNQEIRKRPEIIQPSPDGDVVVRRYPIAEPAEGGYAAGQGVMMSAVVACVLVFSWRWRGSVQMSASLLAQFALRGATFSLLLAIGLEILGEALLQDMGVYADDGFSLGNACMMMIVGASEEGAKLLVVLFGSWISAEALRHAGVDGLWPVLVESPRALMLGGMAVGFGFMLTENAEYMMAVASTPPMRYDYSEADGQDGQLEGAAATLFITLSTISVRVLLNIHPWWAGLSAARLARVTFKEGRETAWPSPVEFLIAITPSALAHAAYDFSVSGGSPAIIGILTPPCFFFTARWTLMEAWNKSGDELEGIEDETKMGDDKVLKSSIGYARYPPKA